MDVGIRVDLPVRHRLRPGRLPAVTVPDMTTFVGDQMHPGGVRSELAARIAADSLSLLDVWLGPEQLKQDMLAVLYAGRHLLLEGPVGSGKTLVGVLDREGTAVDHLGGVRFRVSTR